MTYDHMSVYIELGFSILNIKMTEEYNLEPYIRVFFSNLYVTLGVIDITFHNHRGGEFVHIHCIIFHSGIGGVTLCYFIY